MGKVNWDAVSAIGTFGVFLTTLFSLMRPNVDWRIFFIIYFLFLLFITLVVYRFLFRLIRNGQGGGAVYKVTWGVKHWIENPYTLKMLGHTWDDVESVSDLIFRLYPTGNSIKQGRGRRN